jgi:hypothetical protein
MILVTTNNMRRHLSKCAQLVVNILEVITGCCFLLEEMNMTCPSGRSPITMLPFIMVEHTSARPYIGESRICQINFTSYYYLEGRRIK